MGLGFLQIYHSVYHSFDTKNFWHRWTLFFLIIWPFSCKQSVYKKAQFFWAKKKQKLWHLPPPPKKNIYPYHHVGGIKFLKKKISDLILKAYYEYKFCFRLFIPGHCDITRTFGIKHYAGKVVYDTTDFLGK